MKTTKAKRDNPFAGMTDKEVMAMMRRDARLQAAGQRLDRVASKAAGRWSKAGRNEYGPPCK